MQSHQHYSVHFAESCHWLFSGIMFRNLSNIVISHLLEFESIMRCQKSLCGRLSRPASEVKYPPQSEGLYNPAQIFIGGLLRSTNPWSIPTISTLAHQVMETTKIIIGCFIGITFIAAALLVIFYKMRKRKSPRGKKLLFSFNFKLWHLLIWNNYRAICVKYLGVWIFLRRIQNLRSNRIGAIS